MKKLLLIAAAVAVSAVLVYLVFAIAIDHGGSSGAGASESRLPDCASLDEMPQPKRFDNVRPEQVAVCVGGDEASR